jgi:hypothetical protein
VPEITEPAYLAEGALPVLLTYPTGPALEALLSGTLRRRGPCLVLDTGSRSDLILWLDKVDIASTSGADWLVSNSTTNEQFREGDYLQGGGGSLPESLDLEAVTPEEIPFECEHGSAIVFHGVRKVEKPAKRAGDLPDPPPAPPPPPSFLAKVEKHPRSSGFPVFYVPDVANPREALFSYVIGKSRQSRNSDRNPTMCLTDANDELVERLNRRFGRIKADRACTWDDGRIVVRSNRESAAFIHAKINCAGVECAAEGGATYGNLGGEGIGYRMRRKGAGWTLQEIGLSWIS